MPEVCELDEGDRACKLCGLPLPEWEGQAETSTVVHVISREFVMQEVVPKKYRSTCGGCVETAPGPLKLFPGAHYSIEFAMEVAGDKYLDHLPLERPVRRMGREGSSSIPRPHGIRPTRWPSSAVTLPDRLLQYSLSQPVVWADETWWRIASKDAKPEGGSKRWPMGTVGYDDAAYFTIEESRSADAARSILEGYAGQVMCDGYTAYETLRKRGAAYVLAHCWAHARRAVLRAEKSFPTLTPEKRQS